MGSGFTLGSKVTFSTRHGVVKQLKKNKSCFILRVRLSFSMSEKAG